MLSQVQFELELCGGNILHFFHEVDSLVFLLSVNFEAWERGTT